MEGSSKKVIVDSDGNVCLELVKRFEEAAKEAGITSTEQKAVSRNIDTTSNDVSECLNSE